jgi:hypothetical protein
MQRLGLKFQGAGFKADSPGWVFRSFQKPLETATNDFTYPVPAGSLTCSGWVEGSRSQVAACRQGLGFSGVKKKT